MNHTNTTLATGDSKTVANPTAAIQSTAIQNAAGLNSGTGKNVAPAASITSQAKIDANRQNAAKSTGPRTPEGKAVSSQNAIKHGVWTKCPLLPGEDPEVLSAFRSQLIADLKPEGRWNTISWNKWCGPRGVRGEPNGLRRTS